MFKLNSIYRFNSKTDKSEYIQAFPRVNAKVGEFIGNEDFKVIELASNGLGVTAIEVNGKIFTSHDVYANHNVFDMDEITYFSEVIDRSYYVISIESGANRLRKNKVSLEEAEQFSKHWVERTGETTTILKAVTSFELVTTRQVKETKF